MSLALDLVERGWVPDFMTRRGIRKLLETRLEEERARGAPDTTIATFVDELRASPLALHVEKANEQHYEVPARFFELVLGPRLKYSSCFYGPGAHTLEQAEQAMLALTCERAQLVDGMRILELGCGWGSLTLWMAEHYPSSAITAVSNSAPQRQFIEARARERGLGNVRVVTCDMNDFDAATLDDGPPFDRVVSVEMFEHMRNYELLLERISRWLGDDGRLFVHVFCHREHAYPFEVEGDDNWMGRYFFTGGIMPSADLFTHFDDHLVVEDQWLVNGEHYGRTSEDWLVNLDAHRDEVRSVLSETYGPGDADRWVQRWRVFFLSCAELFNFMGGSEWHVAHYLFRPRTDEDSR